MVPYDKYQRLVSKQTDKQVINEAPIQKGKQTQEPDTPSQKGHGETPPPGIPDDNKKQRELTSETWTKLWQTL